jgi:hypothetical protein
MTDITLNELVHNISTSIIADLRNDNKEKKEKAFNIVLKAYNTYQDIERNGLDYIFDATNIEDTIVVAKGGTSFKEFYDVFNASDKKTIYYMVGEKYPDLVFLSQEEVIKGLIFHLEDVVRHTMVQPYVDGYNQLFHNYISYMLYEKLIIVD